MRGKILCLVSTAALASGCAQGSPSTADGEPTFDAPTVDAPRTADAATVDAPTVDAPTSIDTPRTVDADLPRGAFEGFGRNATGGEGGQVVWVTSLANSGPGSLREAVSGPDRIVRFQVAGTIAFASKLVGAGPNLTIDGFSAPAPGITLTTSTLEIPGNTNGPGLRGSNIVVQGLRIRNVDQDDAIRIAFNAHNIVIDHCSISNSGDGDIDVTEGAFDVTLSYNILSRNTASGASLLSYNASRVTYHHNIFIGARDRNPILTCSYTQNWSTGDPHTDILADVRYNLMWDYGIGTYVLSSDTCVGAANVVANLYQNDGNTNPSNVVVRTAFGAATRADAHIAANAAVHDPRGCAYAYNASLPCYDFQTTNSQNNHAEYAAPPVTGAAPTDKPALLAEWQTVHDEAGVVRAYADDAADAAVRADIVMPTAALFTAPWND